MYYNAAIMDGLVLGTGDKSEIVFEFVYLKLLESRGPELGNFKINTLCHAQYELNSVSCSRYSMLTFSN